MCETLDSYEINETSTNTERCDYCANLVEHRTGKCTENSCPDGYMQCPVCPDETLSLSLDAPYLECVQCGRQYEYSDGELTAVEERPFNSEDALHLFKWYLDVSEEKDLEEKWLKVRKQIFQWDKEVIEKKYDV